MADEMDDQDMDQGGAMAMSEDNAKGMTSGIVILTTVLLLLAIVIAERAMGKWYAASWP